MTAEMLAILGALITILLAINAYFIKGLVETITEVRIDVRGISERLNGADKRVDTAENNLRDAFRRIYSLETKDRRR